MAFMIVASADDDCEHEKCVFGRGMIKKLCDAHSERHRNQVEYSLFVEPGRAYIIIIVI